MRLIVTLSDGGRQEAYGVATVEIKDGYLVTDRGRIPLERIEHAEVKA